jgi:hypothetical protein
MMTRWTTLVAEVVLFLLIAVAGFGQAVHYLWNWLMPELFGCARSPSGKPLA